MWINNIEYGYENTTWSDFVNMEFHWYKSFFMRYTDKNPLITRTFLSQMSLSNCVAFMVDYITRRPRIDYYCEGFNWNELLPEKYLNSFEFWLRFIWGTFCKRVELNCDNILYRKFVLCEMENIFSNLTIFKYIKGFILMYSVAEHKFVELINNYK